MNLIYSLYKPFLIHIQEEDLFHKTRQDSRNDLIILKYIFIYNVFNDLRTRYHFLLFINQE